jgi:imidazolonepropionase-like amidohydrolase
MPWVVFVAAASMVCVKRVRKRAAEGADLIKVMATGGFNSVGFANETGKLEAGLAADVAAFVGNPLEDLNALYEPRFVMACGREHTLTPIEPMGDTKEAEEMSLKILREGAGLGKTGA